MAPSQAGDHRIEVMPIGCLTVCQQRNPATRRVSVYNDFAGDSFRLGDTTGRGEIRGQSFLGLFLILSRYAAVSDLTDVFHDDQFIKCPKMMWHGSAQSVIRLSGCSSRSGRT